MGKTVVFVAATMTNPGIAGVAKGTSEAASAIGWNMQVIDGDGTSAGINLAFSQAIGLDPDGIIVAGFDTKLTARQVRQAKAAGIPLVGWHVADTPRPGAGSELFANVTTDVRDVARISAQWIIAESGGSAGVVIFTDLSIPFARNKSQLIKRALEDCSGVKVLSTEDIPIADSSNQTPQRTASLIGRLGDAWTYSVAINDLYFADAAAALHDAGKPGDGAPLNIGAGDGDPMAFNSIRTGHYQAATVPEPLLEQGWQTIDELNRALSGEPRSGYVAPVHLTTIDNIDGATYWEPADNYREHYMQVWRR
ncbi:substrate-binding domain-containing protein [Hamadaea sp. NPDC051192]|uniref:substrate-binding domain-containing protein n=1 Tax=Hamadaea sp. NPDC051192 TaxID=3154940 RepID=UPI0034169EAA